MPELRFSGGKTSKKHTSIISRKVGDFLKNLQKTAEVEKISTGKIDPQAGGRRTRCLFEKIHGGIRIIIHHEGKRQKIIVYTKAIKIVKEKAKKNFG